MLAASEALDDKRCGEGVDRLDANTVEAHALLERLGIIFAAGVHLRRSVDELAQRDASAVVADGDGGLGDVDFELVAEAHHILVDGVVDHLLEEHIDAVVGRGAVAELADIHARAAAHMLLPFEGDDVSVGVVGSRRRGSGISVQRFVVGDNLVEEPFVCHRVKVVDRARTLWSAPCKITKNFRRLVSHRLPTIARKQRIE